MEQAVTPASGQSTDANQVRVGIDGVKTDSDRPPFPWAFTTLAICVCALWIQVIQIYEQLEDQRQLNKEIVASLWMLKKLQEPFYPIANPTNTIHIPVKQKTWIMND